MSDRRASESPILLLAAHRSGTTLLGLMLAHHPDIAWVGEFEYAVDFREADGRLPARERLVELLETDRRFRARAFELPPELGSRDLLDSFLLQTRERQGKPRVGAAFHRHFDRVVELWPEGRVVHMVRDGRDVALSRIGMGWAGNPWSASDEWRKIEESWERLRPRLPSGQWTEVSYEALVTKPEATLSSLCDFLGLEYSSEMLRYPEDSGYGFPDPGLAAQWRRKLSGRYVALLDRSLGSQLRARGYECATDGRAPGSLERLELRIQDKAYRTRFRLKRFGLFLVALDFVARRAPAPRLRRWVHRRMDRITERHLR